MERSYVLVNKASGGISVRAASPVHLHDLSRGAVGSSRRDPQQNVQGRPLRQGDYEGATSRRLREYCTVPLEHI